MGSIIGEGWLDGIERMRGEGRGWDGNTRKEEMKE